jgi:hypothetical protein
MQESLFPAEKPPHRDYYGHEITRMSHSNDPSTSRKAAKKAIKYKGEHHLKILQALDFKPMTGKELAQFTGLSFVQIARRLHELEPMFIVKTGRKRDNAMEYRKV